MDESTSSTVHAALERILIRSLPAESNFLPKVTSFLRGRKNAQNSDENLDFDKYYKVLQRAVYYNTDPSSPEITEALNTIRALFPNAPPIRVVDNWVWKGHRVQVQSHLKSTYEDAVSNIKATG